MRYNILFGGKAGQGPNVIAHILGETLTQQGYFAFLSREYASVIRGGHNYNILTFSNEPTFSNDTEIDILVALDEKTIDIHKSRLKKDSIILSNSSDNMHFLGKLFRILNLSIDLLEEKIKELKNFEKNIQSVKQGYNGETVKIKLTPTNCKCKFQTGSQGTAEGSIKSGLDIYYAYPMTPATPLLFELAPKQIENGFLTLELENEIAVINAALGSAITGAKSMVGTSGGGFALMTEAISLAGQAEIPIVIYFAQRPGPSTGIPTFTAQGDLNFARHAGHGEFPKFIASPGDPVESQELTSQCFYFSHKFKIPSIILTDKHLSESFYSSEESPKLTQSLKTTTLKRYNSYEHDEQGNAIEESEAVNNAVRKRLQKFEDIKKESQKFITHKIHGKKSSTKVIISWGSTKGAILDSIKDLDVKFIQLLYIEPFPEEIEKELKKAQKIVVIENNSKSPLSDLIAEHTGIRIKNKILRFDGMPFYCNELKPEIKRLLK